VSDISSQKSADIWQRTIGGFIKGKPLRNFRNLKVWERAHKLTVAVYKASESFPRQEVFGLQSQLRRAAVSIPANIAEGCGRESSLDCAHFFQIAAGSTSELDYELLLARDLSYISDEVYAPLSAEVEEIRKMLSALIRTMRAGT
jgi:four helix bundle protein